MLIDLKQLSNRAYLLHLKTDHPTAQVGALKLVADIKFKIADIMRELLPLELGRDKEIKLPWAEPESKVIVQMWKPLKALMEKRGSRAIYYKDLTEGMKELVHEIQVMLATIRDKPGELTQDEWDALTEEE